MHPLVSGYCSNNPKTSSFRELQSISATCILICSGLARVFKTSMVCGWQPFDTRNTSFDSSLVLLKNIAMASAADVASSSSEALEIGKPVKSATIV